MSIDLGGTFRDFLDALFGFIGNLLTGVFGFLAELLSGLQVAVT